jgi:hypothetical protein
MRTLFVCLFVLIYTSFVAQDTNKFRQLEQDLPTPNTYRTASGSPGHEYWQQRADYKMDITIDDQTQKLYGNETITYHNESPDELKYLWLQMDQNVRAKDSHSHDISTSSVEDKMSMSQLTRMAPDFEGGFNIDHVRTADNKNLSYTINKTMMRIDLPQMLKPGKSFTFNIKWWYNINNTREIGGRSGYEHFEADSNNVYVIAQYFPRMCKYNDIYGWQNKQFYGRGEFTLEFGDYEVNITVPADHLVAASGELQNASSVLSAEQQERLNQAKTADLHPVTIATLEEAEKRMEDKSTKTKTWKFKANNVRDFAFATSRRFIWDALGVPMSDGRTVMAMSMWTKEGDCLWNKYSTKAVAHTIKWYSHYTFDYPYPVAWSIDGNMGMEYPMICFNYGRCEDDNTYTERTKYGHIGVIIHEVGHNWFPMIVNSDERQWTWMDEGLNTFMQYLTEQQWERDYPSRRGPADKIVDYMKGDKANISPIMSNSEYIFQFGNNAYGKPATALNILRETIMGRDLFDYSFKEYANRWKFKHPTPADFFRTMEDASAVDLDWFWRSWFYTTDHVDLALNEVKHFQLKNKDPKSQSEENKANRDKERVNISILRNRETINQTQNELDPSIDDFYTNYDPLEVDIIDEEEHDKFIESLSPEEMDLLKADKHFYQMTFENLGGIPMPIIVELEYADGTTEVRRIPAEIWRFDAKTVTKTIVTDKAVTNVVLDPFLETADTDTDNNEIAPPKKADRFELFKRGERRSGENPMQRSNRAKAKQTDKP